MAKTTFKQRVANLGLLGRIALLAVVFLALWLLSIPVALVLNGSIGLLASFTAAAVVGFASMLGMGCGEMLPGANAAMTRLLLGMIIRMAIPLGACLVVLAGGSPLASGGFVFYVLAFYLAALPVDTLLSLAQHPGQQLAGGN